MNAAGFGADSTVIEVTNLNDSGPGSLRAAIDTNARRVIVFRTSGVITLQSDLVVNHGNLTLAGQTAPAPGVAIHGATLNVKAGNVLIQHLRVRPGDGWFGQPTTNRDGVKVSNSSAPLSNVVFDHCTVVWSLDEAGSAWNGWDNLTFNKCIFAEPLHNSIHVDERTFSPNLPPQVENLANAKSGFATTTNTASPLAVGGTYQIVNADSDGDYIEYTLPIVAHAGPQSGKRLAVFGIKGPDRAKFRVEVRDGINDTLLLNPGEIVDLHAPSGAQHTYVSQQNTKGSFTIPANVSTLKVRLIVSGRNGASSGWKLAFDRLAITDGHGFGPLFSSGAPAAGKLSMIHCILAHCRDRGPWSAAQQFYFANNINYDRGWMGLHLGHSKFSQPYRAALLGNTFIDGASTSTGTSLPPPIANSGTPAGSQLFVGTAADNDYNYGSNPAPPPMIGSDLAQYRVVSDPTAKTAGLAGIVALSPAAAFNVTLASAGARPANRDAQETRLIGEIAQGAIVTALVSRPGSIKHSVEAAGGWPEYAVNAASWTLPVNPNADDSSAGYPAGNGYTNIEEWLHRLAAQVEESGGGGRAP